MLVRLEVLASDFDFGRTGLAVDLQRYARLSAEDRRAIVEILRDTKPELPDYFRAVGRQPKNRLTTGNTEDTEKPRRERAFTRMAQPAA